MRERRWPSLFKQESGIVKGGGLLSAYVVWVVWGSPAVRKLTGHDLLPCCESEIVGKLSRSELRRPWMGLFAMFYFCILLVSIQTSHGSGD